MAGGTTRYRTAYNAGASGQDLPGALASMADEDPLIDQAHDAGRNNVPFDQWHQANIKTAPRSPRNPGRPSPGRRGGAGRSGRRGPRSSSSSRSGRPQRPFWPSRGTAAGVGRPSISQPFGGLWSSEGVAGVFMGCVAYALALSVVNYGAKGPGLWFKAKFLNEVGPPAGSVGPGEGKTTMGAFKAGP